MNEKYTYNNRLGMKISTDACKQCGDSSTHKHPGWATRNHKVIIHPDQWKMTNWLQPIPSDIPEADVTYNGR